MEYVSSCEFLELRFDTIFESQVDQGRGVGIRVVNPLTAESLPFTDVFNPAGLCMPKNDVDRAAYLCPPLEHFDQQLVRSTLKPRGDAL